MEHNHLDHCKHIYIHDDKVVADGITPKRECLYKKNAWEKVGLPKACSDNGICPYSDDGDPFEEQGSCSH